MAAFRPLAIGGHAMTVWADSGTDRVVADLGPPDPAVPEL